MIFVKGLNKKFGHDPKAPPILNDVSFEKSAPGSVFTLLGFRAVAAKTTTLPCA